MTDDGWFVDCEPGDVDAASAAVRDGTADEPADWPMRAIEAGFASDEDSYYDALHEATVTAARAEAVERERADDQQLVHAVRAMDDCARTANELAERAAEWAGGLFDATGGGVPLAREVADREPETPAEERAVSLAERVVDLDAEAESLRAFVEQQAPTVAPNLASMAGPVLAARLVSLAGSLESLAKQPSGTVQVLGAEDALFAHLRGRASSPKHGIIYTHEYVRGTHPENRGSASRALAGKLAIAARIDHYSGERKPEIEAELDERIATIRARTGDEMPADTTDDGGDEA
ncbi:NOP58 family protein [Halorubellus sp. JP-L1]|uniref:NOP5/NOP56 family protein n=1 Tax=Halorubellus sp. JP-L1 TaxID=2715753 RepID=UPI00140A68FE|nr:NOP5/NOP56 family protein [Halorubellus sp. JP-L1]NHN40275.1 NOP58 family protein [Halorubellus sp. JP-L1]